MDSEIFWTHEPKLKEIVWWSSCECRNCGGKHKPHKGDKIVVTFKGIEVDRRQRVTNRVMSEFKKRTTTGKPI